MNDSKIKNFKGLELSNGMIENFLKETKASKALHKFNMIDHIRTNTWHELDNNLKQCALKQYLFPKYEKSLNNNDLNELQSLEDMYLFYAYAQKIRNIKSSYTHPSYKDDELKEKLRIVEKATKGFRKYNQNREDILKASDITYFIFQNRSQYQYLINTLFGFIKIDDCLHLYKDLCGMQNELTKISTSTNFCTLGDLNLMIKFNSAFNKFNNSQIELNSSEEHYDTITHAVSSKFSVYNLFNMTQFTDFNNISFDSEQSLDFYKDLFKNRMDIDEDEIIDDSDYGFVAFDYVKNSLDNLFNIQVSTIDNNKKVEELYNIWRWRVIHGNMWGLTLENRSFNEVEVNRDLIQYYCYNYKKAPELYDKVNLNDDKESEIIENDLAYIKKVIEYEYALVECTSFSSKEIDLLINNGDTDEINYLITLLGKIMLVLGRVAYNISVPYIISKESTLFPKNCPHQYAVISVSCREGETLNVSEYETIEGAYISYYDSESIKSLNEGLNSLKSLFKNYETKV